MIRWCLLASLLVSCGAASSRLSSATSPSEAVREAAAVTGSAEVRVLRTLAGGALGRTEGFLKTQIATVFTDLGADGECFDKIVGAGPHSTDLHWAGSSGILQDQDVVVIDIGARGASGYCSDVTRTYPASGRFTERQKAVYQLVLDAHYAVRDAASKGDMSLDEMTTFVSKFFRASPLRADGGRTMDQYFIHALGHYLGTVVHAAGDTSRNLRDGDIITIEPGIYIQSEKLGIRIEDDYGMTADGLVKLSPDVPTTIDEIEHPL